MWDGLSRIGGTSGSVNERQAVSDQLKDIPYTDETAKKIVKGFCDHVHWLISVRYIYKVILKTSSRPA
jgi:hypothetical protein